MITGMPGNFEADSLFRFSLLEDMKPEFDHSSHQEQSRGLGF